MLRLLPFNIWKVWKIFQKSSEIAKFRLRIGRGSRKSEFRILFDMELKFSFLNSNYRTSRSRDII